jgi:uncharacterized membrane protein
MPRSSPSVSIIVPSPSVPTDETDLQGPRRAVVHTTSPSHAMARTCQWESPSTVLAAAEAVEAEADEADCYGISDPADSDDRSGSEIP